MYKDRKFAFEAFGVPISILTNLPDGKERIAAILPPLSRATTGPPLATFVLRADASGTYEAGREGETSVRHLHLRYALEALQRQLRMAVARDARSYVFVHAGAVVHNGRAIILPGESFSGKTTLVAALVRAGARYLSDEFAPLDEHGLVHPFPTALGLRDEVSVQIDHDVRMLGGEVAEQAVPVGAVVITAYRSGAVWAPRRLTAGEAAILLLGHVIPAEARSADAVRVIARAVEFAAVLEGDRGQADSLAPVLLSETICAG